MASPFDILSIETDADDDEIERAYRRRVKETHPDHGGSVREFQLVRAAYEQLTTERPATERDRDVDLEREDGEQRQEGSTVEYLSYDVLEDYGWTLEDEDLFEKASEERLDPEDYGRFFVEPNDSLLEGAENCGFAWPYACRGGACANCAVAVKEGELSMPVNHILPAEMIDRGIRLSCVGAPITEEMQVVYDVKHLPNLDDLRLPPRPFEQANLDD